MECEIEITQTKYINTWFMSTNVKLRLRYDIVWWVVVVVGGPTDTTPLDNLLTFKIVRG